MPEDTRTICIAVHSRANYARIKSVMRAVKEHPNLELQLIVGASALLERYGQAIEQIRADGFEPDATLHYMVEGGTPTTMAKSTGMGIVNMATLLNGMEPDIVLTVADRFETMSTAMTASYMNIPVAHTQGGEITGTIDESVRHAITKLSHIHFPATQKAKKNVIRMGEDPETVHCTGCPAMDVVDSLDLSLPSELFERYNGVGAEIDSDEPFLLVSQHPVTTEYADAREQISETLAAIRRIDMQAIWLWPNIDPGTEQIAEELRIFRESSENDQVRFYTNFSPEDYGRLVANTVCIVGNSSSGIREGSFLGTPTVNIGTRQQGREKAENVIDVGYDAPEIEAAIRTQLENGQYEPVDLYGDGNAGGRIAELLATEEVSIQKRLTYE
ncbi:UDP-N-acetylglucosamine 2-epimerase [Halovenus salina]|uniref:UDP-N-acetylglucosamine 2-epimerase n=1 Tax=Halovenus salina TaxID=1510225 RepID=UPI002260C79A|nr:UDP-N-acetylglucosamine 2-epimerase [Halovenus salina]